MRCPKCGGDVDMNVAHGRQVSKANACLIAAAPEMYGALEWVAGNGCHDMIGGESCRERGSDILCQTCLAQAVLVKARGER